MFWICHTPTSPFPVKRPVQQRLKQMLSCLSASVVARADARTAGRCAEKPWNTKLAKDPKAAKRFANRAPFGVRVIARFRGFAIQTLFILPRETRGATAFATNTRPVHDQSGRQRYALFRLRRSSWHVLDATPRIAE